MARVPLHGAREDHAFGIEAASHPPFFAPDLDLAVQSDASVLIDAVSLTTRQRCARLIHDRGRRCRGRLVTFRCDVDRGGWEPLGRARRILEPVFEQAHGGTLFLDEIGAMSPHLQRELVALLDAGANARIVAGTSHSLLAQIEARTFTSALYYRLNVIHLSPVPYGERIASASDIDGG